MDVKKTVFITGANRGLGAELTLVFLANDWNVIAASRRGDLPEGVKQDAHVTSLMLDLSDQESIDAVVPSLHGRKIDVLINNAGVFDAPSVDENASALSLREMQDLFAVNTLAPRILAEKLTPNLEIGSEKLVITISSGMGTHAKMSAYHAEHWVYSASKAAVNYAMIAFGKTHPGIRSVLIGPGWMKTRLGGKDAPLEPRITAQGIFALVSGEKDGLQGGVLIDYQGKKMDL